MPERNAEGTAGRTPGRPRDPEADERILVATRELLVEDGYDALSYEVVARRAGVSRPTIYRRWPSKLHLLYDAAFPTADLEPITDTGEFSIDLERFAASAGQAYSRPETRAALPALLPHLTPGSALHEASRDPLTRAARQQFRDLVEAAIDRGEVREGLDAELLFDTVVGLVMFQVVFQGNWSRDAATSLVDLLDLGFGSH